MNGLTLTLHQFLKVGAGGFSHVAGFIACQEVGFDSLIVGPVDVGIKQGVPPEDGVIPEDEIDL